MYVHFENNSPFLHATRLVREVEVSHWGNVYVEEKYYIRSVAGLGCSHVAMSSSSRGRTGTLEGSTQRPCRHVQPVESRSAAHHGHADLLMLACPQPTA